MGSTNISLPLPVFWCVPLETPGRPLHSTARDQRLRRAFQPGQVQAQPLVSVALTTEILCRPPLHESSTNVALDGPGRCTYARTEQASHLIVAKPTSPLRPSKPSPRKRASHRRSRLAERCIPEDSNLYLAPLYRGVSAVTITGTGWSWTRDAIEPLF